MNNAHNVIPHLLKHAVECVLRGEHEAARSSLASIDHSRLVADRKLALRLRRSRLASRAFLRDSSTPIREDSHALAKRKQRRSAVPRSTMLGIFQRDRFICRYEHCRRRTIYVPTLRVLSTLFPDLVPYNKNWRPIEEHILYWAYGASVEHLISFPHGGSSDPENLITACYQCNEIKNMLWADDLGWVVGDVRPDDWDGLSGCIKRLADLSQAQCGPGRREARFAAGTVVP